MLKEKTFSNAHSASYSWTFASGSLACRRISELTRLFWTYTDKLKHIGQVVLRRNGEMC